MDEISTPAAALVPSEAVVIRVMEPLDFPAVRELWEASEGIGLGESDNAAAIAGFLARNPGLSAVAVARDGRIIGAILCGHDGRRGYLHHLAVAREHRRRGLARALIDHGLQGLRHAGIPKCNLFVLSEHESGRTFWEHHGWRRPDWYVMQRDLSGCAGDTAGRC